MVRVCVYPVIEVVPVKTILMLVELLLLFCPLTETRNGYFESQELKSLVPETFQSVIHFMPTFS